MVTQAYFDNIQQTIIDQIQLGIGGGGLSYRPGHF